jgi:hypothetical protein
LHSARVFREPALLPWDPDGNGAALATLLAHVFAGETGARSPAPSPAPAASGFGASAGGAGAVMVVDPVASATDPSMLAHLTQQDFLVV